MIRPVTDTFAVAPQISASDIPAIAEMGFKSVICNRPDHEEPDQPTYEEIRKAAEAAGLTCSHIPMSNHTGLQPELIEATKQALNALPGPILAYCRSGTRSTHLFMAAQRG